MALLSPAGIGVKTNGRSAWLDAPAANSYRRMLADGCPTGGITDAGRTRTEQQHMYDLYLAGKLKATAAVPGTSKHETGRALDLSGAALAWVRAHGREYGWLADQVRNERWHVEYHPAWDKHADKPAPAPKPAPTLKPAPPVIPTEALSMDEILTRAFRHHTGFAPTPAQLDEWTVKVMKHGLAWAEEQIAGSAAAQVARIFDEELGRKPESSDTVSAYLRQFGTDFAAMRAGIRSTPEAQAHRARA